LLLRPFQRPSFQSTLHVKAPYFGVCFSDPQHSLAVPGTVSLFLHICNYAVLSACAKIAEGMNSASQSLFLKLLLILLYWCRQSLSNVFACFVLFLLSYFMVLGILWYQGLSTCSTTKLYLQLLSKCF
jgi:hypothetical protein